MFPSTYAAVKVGSGIVRNGKRSDGSMEDLLASKAKVGEKEAFRALVQPHLRLFTGGIQRILQDEQQTQAVLKRALLSVFSSLNRNGESGRFTAWAYHICLAEALMTRRQSARG